MLFWQAPPTQQQLEQLPGVTRSALERLLRQRRRATHPPPLRTCTVRPQRPFMSG
jgi:hypothetical protein